ncbi:MAG: hypothetical protein HDR88_14810 [Bacteroides sp.]|nr:hypothetical protein [Bacteroides sp.]
MRNIIFILLSLVAVSLISCSRSEPNQTNALNGVESLMGTNLDSAITILDTMDPSELKADSIRAKYHYLKAWGHMRQNRSMIGDSLIALAHNYYKGTDLIHDIRSGTAFAWYKFWIGDMAGAISMLDSISRLPNIPDSLMVHPLRIYALLGASEYQGEQLIPIAKRLINLETDVKKKLEAKCILVNTYENAEKMDSALMLTDEIIEYARNNKLGEIHFQILLERAQILTELGRYKESEEDVDYIFQHGGPENGAADYLHMIYAMNALNTGNIARASKEIALADSFAIRLRPDDETYYRSYSNLIHTMIDFKQTGKMRLKHVSGLNNRQRERYHRMEASQWESERGALEQQSRALALKAESQQKTVIILVITLISVILLVGAGLIIRQRRLRELENEERVEALQKMVDELKSMPSTPQTNEKMPSALRRAMLQQLGIIKMVAETPTEQNREMLRKISSIDSDTNGELVNWENIFELINHLYSGFYNKLHSRYGETLSPKEEQIIVLMMAGFSTKEISVITAQTTSTIYVRKSSIRKKLGVPEKEDIMIFLSEKLSH